LILLRFSAELSFKTMNFTASLYLYTACLERCTWDRHGLQNLSQLVFWSMPTARDGLWNTSSPLL